MSKKFSIAAVESGEATFDDDAGLAYHFYSGMQQDMLQSRGGKFGTFFYLMEMAGVAGAVILPKGKERITFLKTYYALMRYIDDIVDGDRPMPKGCTSAAVFVEELLAWNERHRNGEVTAGDNPIQRLLAYCYETGTKFGEDFHTETDEILTSMLFDARRRGTAEIHSEHDLQTYFHSLDINGTVRGCLKACGEDACFEEALTPLGQATRIYYNLRDLEEDIQAGLINISSEDIARLGITHDDLQRGMQSEKILRWWQEQAAIELNLIETHRKTIQTLPLRTLTKNVLHWIYERPAEKFLLDKLEEMNGVRLQSPTETIRNHPVRYVLAAFSSAYLNLKHGTQLELRTNEERRFAKKARNLAVLYSDFTETRSPVATLRATEAGLLCTAYDVASDWRKFDPRSAQTFQELLVQYCSPYERNVATDLYDRDKKNELKDDGLERGSVCLELIVSMMDIRDEFTQRGIDILIAGRELQIIDDILDYEDDKKVGDTNCLTSPNATSHLEEVLRSKTLELFPEHTALRQTIERARLKARLLLKDLRADFETSNTQGVLDGDIQPFIDSELKRLA